MHALINGVIHSSCSVCSLLALLHREQEPQCALLHQAFAEPPGVSRSLSSLSASSSSTGDATVCCPAGRLGSSDGPPAGASVKSAESGGGGGPNLARFEVRVAAGEMGLTGSGWPLASGLAS